MHPACRPISELFDDCQLTRLRQKGSGAGGQRKNKVATAVRLVHEPTGLAITAAERREPEANKQQALFRLRLALAVGVRGTALDWPGGVSALWQGRLKGQQLAINPAHDDFPAILAEALDGLAMHGWAVAEAAAALGVSSSHLVKLLAKHPPALGLLNDQRKALGLSPCRA